MQCFCNNFNIQEFDKQIYSIHKKWVDLVCEGIDSNISLPHLYLLGFIQSRKSCIVSEIAQYLKITLSGVTSLLNKLVSMKLVTRKRSEEDRRIVIVELTEEGRKILELRNKNIREIFTRFFKDMDKEEVAIFFSVLEKIALKVLKEENKVGGSL